MYGYDNTKALIRGYENRFSKGDIVYWCGSLGNGQYTVKYGMVDEQFSDAVYVDFLELKEHRIIDGIPFNEWVEDSHYRKLPKGWTYNTPLYNLEWQNITETPEYKVWIDKLSENGILDSKEFTYNLIVDPIKIKIAYSVGLLVKSSTIFHGDIYEEITKEGYRIVKKHTPYTHHIDYTTVRPDKLYFTYEEAQKEVDENKAEFARQAAMSDYEWSVFLIDKELDRWQKLYSISDKIKKEYRNFLLSRDDIEEIEIRIFEDNIQWKNWKRKHKKWANIEI